MSDMDEILKRLDKMQANADIRQAVHTEEHRLLSDTMVRVESQVRRTNGQLLKAKENIVENTVAISEAKGRNAGIAMAISSIGVMVTLLVVLL